MRAAAVPIILCCSTFFPHLSAVRTTLVALDDTAYLNTHSEFFDSLRARGHRLVFADASSEEAALSRYGEWLYDDLVLVAPSVAEFHDSIDVATVVDFIDNGHSVFVAGDVHVGYAIRELAGECSIEFDDEPSLVIDHSSFDIAAKGSLAASNLLLHDEHTLIVAEAFADVDTVVGVDPQPVLYRGIGMAVSEENDLVLRVLSGSTAAYSHDTAAQVKATPYATGRDLLFVAGLQARNNARLVISGSWDMFSNDFNSGHVQSASALEPISVGNRAFAESLTGWVFGDTGVIRATNITHRLTSTGTTQETYTVSENVTYSLRLEERQNGQWVPYIADDVQMEFVMLDPYYRLDLIHTHGGHYSVTFQLPDVYGVFQFIFDYDRAGLSQIYNTQHVRYVHRLGSMV
eukprot:SAG31_NODE_12_length_38498_cov_21.161671_29_plen_404_part_00